jgi:hypothetical protein
MSSIRCIDVQARSAAFLDGTSLTLDEFELLVPPCAAAFQAHTAGWRFAVDACPLPRAASGTPYPLALPRFIPLQRVRNGCVSWKRRWRP